MDEWIIGLTQKYNGYGMVLFILITCSIAAVLSGFVGLEREKRGQAAGLRTHVILSVACSLLMSISIYAIRPNLVGNNEDGYYDASRIGAGILAGVGFMGTGAIVKNGLNIRGLTTAATVWFVSAVGMACGSGFVLEAIVVTGIVILLNFLLVLVEKEIDRRSPIMTLKVAPNVPILHELRATAEKFRLVIKSIYTENKKDEKGQDYVQIRIHFAYHSDPSAMEEYKDSFSAYPYVFDIQTKESSGFWESRKKSEDSRN